MRIGVLGLGHIGLPIARSLHSREHEVFSWSRTPMEQPWIHSTSLETMGQHNLDSLLIASGNVRPGLGDHVSEIKSTLDLIPNSLRDGTNRILYLSSGAVYGECSTPKSESDQIAPTTSYGKSKAYTEHAFEEIFKERFSSLRISNVIDWNMPYGIFAMAKKAKENRFLDLFGRPEDCRDYLDVSDLCLMIARILELDLREKAINLGSGYSISIEEFRKMFIRFFPDVEIRWQPSRGFDVSRTVLDVSKIRKLTSVTPRDPNLQFEHYFSGLSCPCTLQCICHSEFPN
jgi:nucleoside-diphosphate-sugar epimerase